MSRGPFHGQNQHFRHGSGKGAVRPQLLPKPDQEEGINQVSVVNHFDSSQTGTVTLYEPPLCAAG